MKSLILESCWLFEGAERMEHGCQQGEIRHKKKHCKLEATALKESAK